MRKQVNKAILYCKNNSNNTNYYAITMRSKPKAPFTMPFYSNKMQPLYCKQKYELAVDNFDNLYLANQARSGNLESILRSHIYYFYYELETAVFFNNMKMPKHNYLYLYLNYFYYGNKRLNLTMIPNHANKYYGNNQDFKNVKVCTIILIGCMTLALKVLAMLTLSMGTLILEEFII